MSTLRERIKIPVERLNEINSFLTDPNNVLINQLLEVIESHGGPEEINRKAAEAGALNNLCERLRDIGSTYLEDIEWLIDQKEKHTFVSLSEYYERILNDPDAGASIDMENRVTLEISALQYFPWIISQAKRAIEKRELMPGRYIRVRSMDEQKKDNGDILAVAAAMQIVGASYVETLDTKGTDGSNVHLGGPETITGYFGGVGQPNDYPIKWLDEYLYYFTHYGIRQVLNINPGTVLAGYLLHKLGIDNEFKISVFMGNDNPFSVLWTLLTAKLFSRPDGSTSLVGFNLSNSVNNDTIRQAAKIRKSLNLEDKVRLEHHITETYKSIVRQPYNRRDELLEVARDVANIAAKHEGGDPDVESTLPHPSDILDYFMSKKDIQSQELMEALENNYLEKHISLNRTADALTRSRIGVVCAWNLHK